MTGGVEISNGTIQTAVATNAFGNTTGITIGASSGPAHAGASRRYQRDLRQWNWPHIP